MNELYTSTCECGAKLNYKISAFETNEKRVCEKCGKIHYVDNCPIDFEKINKHERELNKNRR